MSEKERKIQDTIQALLSVMTEQEKDYLIAFGEGMLAMANQQRGNGAA